MKKNLVWVLFIMPLATLSLADEVKTTDENEQSQKSVISPENQKDNNQDKKGKKNAQRQRPQRKNNYEINLEVKNNDGSSNLALNSLLKEHLSIYNKQKVPNIDTDQVAFIVQETPEEVNQILRTEGFFFSQTEIKENKNTYTVLVKTGEQSHIDNINLNFKGEIERDNEKDKYLNDIKQDWQLKVGEAFSQSKWSSDKTQALAVVTHKKYPLAIITESKAEINPENKKANLKLEIDSKNLVKFGDVNIQGVERYPESLPRNLIPFKYGDNYNLDKLVEYQQLLEQDGHYSTVSVFADLDNISSENIVPVIANLVEVPRQKLDLGLQYDTEDGLGFRIGYDHYNMFRKGYTGSSTLKINTSEQVLGLGISQPKDSKGHFYTTNMTLKNKTVQGLKTQTASFGFWKARIRNNIESRIGIEHYWESAKFEHGGTIGTSYVTMPTASFKINRIKPKERPARGYYFSGKVGSTIGTVLSTANAQRITSEFAYYYTPEKWEYGTWIVRTNFGYVMTNKKQKVPNDLLFRIGGIDTVRGYENESIGIPGPTTDVVFGGKAMIAGSLEYQYPLNKSWSIAVFHDAGDVKDNFKDIELKHSTGVGVRWFSPIAPLAFDIAYAHQRSKIGWYITLGAKF